MSDPAILPPSDEIQRAMGFALAMIDMARGLARRCKPVPGLTPAQALEGFADAAKHAAQGEWGSSTWFTFVGAIRREERAQEARGIASPREGYKA